MPSYKVTKPGFYGGVLRTPGGRHDPVVTSKPLKSIPSWLEEIKPEKPTKGGEGGEGGKGGKGGKGGEKPAVSEPVQSNDTPASFIGEDKDVETL